MCDKNPEQEKEQIRINKLLQSFELKSAVITSVEGFFYRTVNYRYSCDPLSTRGAELTGGRYNFKPKQGNSFSCLYCGDEEFTASTEKFYGLKLKNEPRPPHTMVAIEVKLCRILDLRIPKYCARAGINWEAIYEPWEYHQDILGIPAYTQSIGMIAYEDGGIEGIIFTSTKVKTHSCLAIYTERMLVGSFIAVYDPRNELPGNNKVLQGLSGFSNDFTSEES